MKRVIYCAIAIDLWSHSINRCTTAHELKWSIVCKCNFFFLLLSSNVIYLVSMPSSNVHSIKKKWDPRMKYLNMQVHMLYLILGLAAVFFIVVGILFFYLTDSRAYFNHDMN